MIRDWPAGPERRDQAERYIREAMYLHTIGRISQAEASAVYSILSFAMGNGDQTQPDPPF